MNDGGEQTGAHQTGGYGRGPSRGGRLNGQNGGSKLDRANADIDHDKSQNVGSHGRMYGTQQSFTLDPGAFPVLEASNGHLLSQPAPSVVPSVSQMVGVVTQQRMSASPILASPNGMSPVPGSGINPSSSVELSDQAIAGETENTSSTPANIEVNIQVSTTQNLPGQQAQPAELAQTVVSNSTPSSTSAANSGATNNNTSQLSSLAQNVPPARFSYAAMVRGNEQNCGSAPATSPSPTPQVGTNPVQVSSNNSDSSDQVIIF